MHRVFLSVANADRAYARALRDLLANQSAESGPTWDCYFYEYDAEQGPIPESVAKEIETRETFIAIVTSAYFESGYCVNESHYARFLGRQVHHFRPTEAHPVMSDLNQQLQPALFDTDPGLMPIAFGETEIRDVKGNIQRVKLAPLAFKHLTERARDPLEMLPQWLEVPADLKKPFPGMTAFAQDMGGIFFGRDGEISQAIRRFRDFERNNSGVFVVQGPSGSGKSSFMRAGLLARLARAKDRYFVADTFKPQQGPGHDLVSKLKRPHSYFLMAVQGLLDELKYRELESQDIKIDALARFLRARVDEQARAMGLPEGRPIIFPVDQGEELFIGEATNPELEEIGAFLGAIEKMVQASQRVFFFMTARSEQQVARIVRMQVPVDSILLPQMQLAQLSAIIKGPLERAEFSHVRIEQSAVDVLTEQAARIAKRETALPLISHALRELWEVEDRTKGRSTVSLPPNYRLDQQLDAKLAAALEELQRTFSLKPEELNPVLKKFFFNYFIVPDHDGNVRFKPAYDTFAGNDYKIAETFVRFRLLLGDRSPEAPSYELVHETLAQKWDWMKDWVEERREAFTTFSLFDREANQWTAKFRTDENVVYSSYHFRRLQTLCNGDLDRFAKVAEEKLGFPTEGPLNDYVQRFLAIHRMTEESAKEKEKEVEARLGEVRAGALKLRKSMNRGWLIGAAVVGLAVIGGGVVGASAFQRQSELRVAAQDDVAHIRGEWVAADATLAERLGGCWIEWRPIRPADCDKFRLEVTASTGDGAEPGTGQLSRTCLYNDADTATRSYQVRSGALTTESMYPGLAGQWRFVSDGETLLWTVAPGSATAATGIYHKVECEIALAP